MATQRIYLREWLEKLGKNQTWLCEVTGLNKSHLSKIVNGHIKRQPERRTRDKIEEALGIPYQQLWVDPFRNEPRMPQNNLEDWLNDPHATFNGKIADVATKEKVKQILDLVLSQRANDEGKN